MADKKISDLTAIGANCLATDLFVTEHALGGAAVKATLTQVMALEVTARAAQDDVIEASTGLTAGGAYQAPAGSHYLGGATSCRSADGLLDDQVYANATAIAGLSSYITAKVTISNAEVLSLHVAEKTLVATGGANTVIEVLSVFCHSQPIGATAWATGDDILVTYAGETDALFSLDAALIKGAGCFSVKGLVGVQKDMNKNTAVVAKCTVGYTAGGGGTIDVYIAYRIVTLSACAY
jgi:hypothetical protein